MSSRFVLLGLAFSSPWVALGLAGGNGAATATSSGSAAGSPRARIATWTDADADGRADVLALEPGGAVRLFLARPGAPFQDATLGSGLEGLVGVSELLPRDYDRDGRVDLFVRHAAGGALYRNVGGSYVDVTARAGIVAGGPVLAAAWVGRSGAPADLVVADAGGTTLFANAGDGTFAAGPLPATLASPAAPLAPGANADFGRSAAAPPAGFGPVAAGGPAASGERAVGSARPTVAAGTRAGASSALAAGGAQSATSAGGAHSPFGCANRLHDQATGQCLEASSDPVLGSLYPLSPDLFVASDGDVGLGTTSPLTELHVKSDDSTGVLRIESTGLGGGAQLQLEAGFGTTDGMSLLYDQAERELGVFSGSGLGGGSGPHLTVEHQSGYVGVHNDDPIAELDVSGDLALTTKPGATSSMRLRYDDVDDQLEIAGEGAGSFTHLVVERGSGRVGIGTQDPLEDLHVSGDGLFTGDVGVGTTAPVGDLHVQGDANLGQLVVSTAAPVIGGSAELVLAADDDNSASMTTRYDSQAAQYQVEGRFGSIVYGPHLVIDYLDGDVGLGTTTPGADLHVVGGSTLGALHVGPVGDVNESSELYLMEDNDGTYGMRFTYDGGDNKLYLTGHSGSSTYGPHLTVERNSGYVGIGTTDPLTPLHVSGIIRAGGLDIVAGADLVEGFETSDGVAAPGTVLVIDPDAPGRLRTSRVAYDTKVAGIVSGAGGVDHGIRLGQPGVDGDTLVAMTGRVWVRATSAGGPIRPGDRLTTASLAGHAMRVEDDARAPGAVLGKAMTALDDGTGLVLCLVNLQ